MLLIASYSFGFYYLPPPTLSDEAIWKLGWRMTENYWNEHYELAELQFDSLLAHSHQTEEKFLIVGLQIKNQQGKKDELATILSNQPSAVLREVCQRPFAKEFEACRDVPREKVKNPTLQRELLAMYVDDQASRGNLMKDIIERYQLDSARVTQDNGVAVDQRNRDQLKKIIKKHGFPDRALVGRDAMRGVFLIIQHADRDQEWQQSQLSNIELAVHRDDLDGQAYAYLYDRIQRNSGKKQRYGTQFVRVDPEEKIVELADTEAVDSLDERRREIGMMPIETYKRFMLKNL